MLSGVYYTRFLLFRGGADVAQQQGDLSNQNLVLEYSEGTGFLLLGTEPLRRTTSLDLPGTLITCSLMGCTYQLRGNGC